MGDISTWNPVDNSNTAAPPDGWPEGQSPASVNNCARAMMGAVRRWYDTVTAQLASLTASVASLTTADNLRVLKAGDTMTGTLSAPQYNINGVPFANGDGVTTHIYDGAGGSGLHLQAAINYYDADTHVFRNNAGSGNGAVVDASGNFTIGGNYVHFLASTGTVNTTGGPLIFADLNNHVYKLGAGNAGWSFQNYAGANVAIINSSGGLSLATVNATGNITAPAFVGNVSVPANGPVTTGGTVTGGTVNSTGDANIAGTLTAGTVHCTGALMTVDNSLYVGGPVTFNNSLLVNGVCSNVTGAWVAVSDREVKENIVTYDARGLAAVLALRPVSFNYRADLFGPEEAEKTRYGLVADEVEPVLPEMVGQATFGGRHLSTLNTGHLNIVLVRACQDLAAQNAALAARLALLEAEFGAAGR